MSRFFLPFSMGRIAALALTAALLIGTFAVNAVAVDRFPRPEFSADYHSPLISTPLPRASFLGIVDIAALAAALAAASHLALKARSRRGIVLLSILCLLYFGFWRKGCVCPVGAIQNVAAALFDKTYFIPVTALAFFVLPLVFTLFFGRTFCAAVCPLGAVQDAVAIKPLKVPAPLAYLLGIIPWLYLGIGVLLAATGVGYLICRLDPFVGFFRLSGRFSMLMLGGIFLVLGIFVARPYCRFICPYGPLLGLMSRFALRHVTITPGECIQCRLCEDACPFGAILRPTPTVVPETRSHGVRRLILVLVAVPLSILAGGWIGSRLDVPLSRRSIVVRTAERVYAENTGAVEGTTLDSESFRNSGILTSALLAEGFATRVAVRHGGWLLGAFAGLVICVRLLSLSVHRTRVDYEPDPANCLSCARCFLSCPNERERLKNPAGRDAGPDRIQESRT